MLKRRRLELDPGVGYFHEMLNPFPNKPWLFMCLQYKSFENAVRKGEIARNKI